MPASSSSQSIAGNISFGDDNKTTLIVVSVGAIVLGLIVWLLTRK